MINKLKELRAGGEEEGFTLIELMIVVVIIGILAAIAIPVFANQQKSAITAGVKSDVKNTNTNIVTALVKSPTDASVAGTWTGVAASTQDATSAADYKMVKSNDLTAITVAGGWDNYTILATNTSVGTAATVTGAGTAAVAFVAGSTFGVLYNSSNGKLTQQGG